MTPTRRDWMRMAVTTSLLAPHSVGAFAESICDELRDKRADLQIQLDDAKLLGLSDEQKRILLWELQDLNREIQPCADFEDFLAGIQGSQPGRASSPLLQEGPAQTPPQPTELGLDTSAAAVSGPNPDDSAVDQLYVLTISDPAVWVVDSGGRSVAAQIVIRTGDSIFSESDMAATPDGRTVIVAVASPPGELVFVDTVGRRVDGRLPLAGAFPASLTVSPDGTLVYATAIHGESPFGGSRGSVQVVDIATRQVVDEIDLGPATSIQQFPDIAVSPDGGLLFVADRRSRGVVVADVRSRTVSTVVDLLTAPSRLAVHRDGTRLYAFPYLQPFTGLRGIGVIDVATATSVRAIELPEPPSGRAEMVLSPASDILSVSSHQTPTVWHIDTLDETVGARTEVGLNLTRLVYVRGA